MQRRAGRLTPSLSALLVAKMRGGAGRRASGKRRLDDAHSARDVRPARRARAAVGTGRSGCADVSRAGDHARRAVCARRQRQHRGARRRRQDERDARPADRDRQPRRGWRHRGDARDRKERARWLHPPGGHQRHGRHLAEPVPEPGLRSTLAAPAGTPRAIVDKLNAALNAALATDEVRARLALEGAEAQPTTPEDYAAIIDREVTMWSDLVKAAGIKPE